MKLTVLGCSGGIGGEQLRTTALLVDHDVLIDAGTGVADLEMILDIGPRSAAKLAYQLHQFKTLVWNGPFGAFEMEPFNEGTNTIARAAAELTKAGSLLTVAGGGDTVAALNQAGVGSQFTYVSTAGGAFLEWLEGKELPGVEALRIKSAAPRVTV